MNQYPRRLIEVDLPIKRISAHARREKSIRHGHISTLHIWWARRPLAACRAVILASLWPDPAPGPDDAPCPPAFLDAARTRMTDWALKHAEKASKESFPRLMAIQANPNVLVERPLELRNALLDFIADFANWDNSTDKDFLDTSRALVQAAHEALGGAPGTRPLVVDPFAGGGSIPLEALRVGADAFASDLNPVAVLLNKVVLEYIPKYGQQLADEVRKWGEWIKQEAEKELGRVLSEGPGWRDAHRLPLGAHDQVRRSRMRRGGPACPLALALQEDQPIRGPATRAPAQSEASRLRDHSQATRWLGRPGRSENQDRRPEVRRHCEARLGDLPLLRLHDPSCASARAIEGTARWVLAIVECSRCPQLGQASRVATIGCQPTRDLKAVRAAAIELERRAKNHKGESQSGSRRETGLCAAYATPGQ